MDNATALAAHKSRSLRTRWRIAHHSAPQTLERRTVIRASPVTPARSVAGVVLITLAYYTPSAWCPLGALRGKGQRPLGCPARISAPACVCVLLL